MSQKERNALDNHITGHYGEDQFKPARRARKPKQQLADVVSHPEQLAPTDEPDIAPPAAAPAPRTVRLTHSTTKVGYTVTLQEDAEGKGTLKAFGFGENGVPVPDIQPIALPAPQKFVDDMVTAGWQAENVNPWDSPRYDSNFIYHPPMTDEESERLQRGTPPQEHRAPQQQPLSDPVEGNYVAAPGNLKTAESALKFILAGNAYFTVRSLKTGVRYTYRVNRADCSRCGKKDCKCWRFPTYFVALLTGPDNTGDYTYLGMIRENLFRLTRGSKMQESSTPVKAFRWVYERLTRRELPAQTEIWHEGRCGVCGRPLTVPESIESGIGPVCAEKGGM